MVGDGPRPIQLKKWEVCLIKAIRVIKWGIRAMCVLISAPQVTAVDALTRAGRERDVNRQRQAHVAACFAVTSVSDVH